MELFSNITNTVTEHQPLKIGKVQEKIDLNAMARKYKSGLYYMMCVVDQKFQNIREKKLVHDFKKGKPLKLVF